MGDKSPGIIERITIEIRYPKEETRVERVIEGDELKRLALLAFTPAAIREHLEKLDDHEQIVRHFEEGFDAPDRGKPNLLTVYSDGTYSEECDYASHIPPNNS